jgi:hypothetical protein
MLWLEQESEPRLAKLPPRSGRQKGLRQSGRPVGRQPRPSPLASVRRERPSGLRRRQELRLGGSRRSGRRRSGSRPGGSRRRPRQRLGGSRPRQSLQGGGGGLRSRSPHRQCPRAGSNLCSSLQASGLNARPSSSSKIFGDELRPSVSWLRSPTAILGTSPTISAPTTSTPSFPAS